MFNLLSEGILSDSIQRMGKLKSSWTSHAPTAYSICCITSWCQDENHEDCLCPDKNFHSKHLRNLFLIEVFYYLNPLHTTWKTCSQYWTPTLNQETLYPVFLPHGALQKSPVFRVAMGCLFLKAIPRLSIGFAPFTKLGTGPCRTHGVACFLRIAGGLLHRKHTIVMANVIHHENII
jgi:hypothetical protein